MHYPHFPWYIKLGFVLNHSLSAYFAMKFWFIPNILLLQIVFLGTLLYTSLGTYMNEFHLNMGKKRNGR